MDISSVFFGFVTLVAIISALLVVTCKNPINSALSLVLTFFCLATYYAMLNAPFMAAIQIIVYAGAIMVLIVFTIMLLNIRVDANKKGHIRLPLVP
jgi:NADH-quinone oxidoreductase subunit J